jgi:hypothetical protein
MGPAARSPPAGVVIEAGGVNVLGFRCLGLHLHAAGLREEGSGVEGIDRRWAAGKAAESRRPG